jgi:hypothetical protein
MSDPGFSLSDQFDRAAAGIPLPPRERWLPAPHEHRSGRMALGGLAAAAVIAAIAAVTLYGIGARPGQVLAPQAPVEASPRPFGDVVRLAATNPYRVTYRVSSTTGGDSEQTWYLSGPRVRMDLPTSTSIYVGPVDPVLPDGSFSCFNAAPLGVQCHIISTASILLEAHPFGITLGATFNARIRADPDSFDARFIGMRSIAGTSAACYALGGGVAGFSKATICYTDAGVPVLYQFAYPYNELQLSITMEATSFGVATDADFRLPAPPVPWGGP